MSRKKSLIDQSSFGGRIEERLSNLNVRRKELAKGADISENYLSEIIRGVKSPSGRMLRDIAQRLNVTEEWLRTGEGAKLQCQFAETSDKGVAEPPPGYLAAGPDPQVIAKAVEILSCENSTLRNALEQNIVAFHQALVDSRLVRAGHEPGKAGTGKKG